MSMNEQLEQAKLLLANYALRYQGEYGERWVPSDDHVRDAVEFFRPALPGLATYTAEEACGRLDLFFKTKEDWVVSCRHNFSVFLKHFHRWVIVKKKFGHAVHPAVRVAVQENVCQDHPEVQLKPGEICPVCYPVCEKCKDQHDAEVSCETHASLREITRRVTGAPPKRGGNAISLGDLLLGEKQ